MKKVLYSVFCVLFLISSSCKSVNESVLDIEEEIIVMDDIDDLVEDTTEDTNKNGNFKIICLGDSYTIGQSVCEECSFPAQLTASLLTNTKNKSTFPLKIIARTGWTTSNLISAINSEKLASDYNFATLLIGVNNQYQSRKFSLYEEEFSKLVDIAIKSVQGDATKVVVLSIPDYAFTPFGGGSSTISAELKKYNDFAESYCIQNNITFLNITDITQQGLTNSTLVANDGLHPSKEAYAKFVERLVPIVLEKLGLK